MCIDVSTSLYALSMPVSANERRGQRIRLHDVRLYVCVFLFIPNMYHIISHTLNTITTAAILEARNMVMYTFITEMFVQSSEWVN